MEYSRMLLGTHFIAPLFFSFFQNSSIWFTTGIMTYLISGLGHMNSARHGFHLMKEALSPIR